MTDDTLRYPIGRYSPPAAFTDEWRAQRILEISELPRRLRDAVSGVGESRADTPYRPGGWTVRQLVHHLADSHMHAFIRFKLALTEENPTIRPYLEGAWAELADSREPVGASLDLIGALHDRWTALLASMSEADFQRTFHHPERGRNLSLDDTLGLYAWHGAHHLAHVTELVRREGWLETPAAPLPT